MSKLRRILTDKVGWAVGIVLGLFIWTYIYAQVPPVKVHNTYGAPSVAITGKPYTICRSVEYSEPIIGNSRSIKLDRSIMQNLKNGDIFTVNLASLTIVREAGHYNVCRDVIIPEYIQAGEWIIKTFITYKSFIWTMSAETTPVPVTVKRGR